MAEIGHEHLHHMAKRLAHTNQKLADIKGKLSGFAERSIDTIEIGAAAWLGGTIEGRTDGAKLPIVGLPVNLAIGFGLMVVSHLHLAGEQWSNHVNNLASGFIGSYAAAVGYAFGKSWRETGKIWGGHSLTQPYALGPAHASGELSQAQMADIVSRMQQAAQGAHP
jgi:hypothetical protein